MGEMGGAYTALMGKPDGKRPLRIPRHRREVNIKMDLQGLEWEGINWITQDNERWWALVNAEMNLRFHKMWGISWLTEGASLSFSGRTQSMQFIFHMVLVAPVCL
jgi:hypothetical protein